MNLTMQRLGFQTIDKTVTPSHRVGEALGQRKNPFRGIAAGLFNSAAHAGLGNGQRTEITQRKGNR